MKKTTATKKSSNGKVNRSEKSQKIIAFLKAGHTNEATEKKFDVNTGWINLLRREEGIPDKSRVAAQKTAATSKAKAKKVKSDLL